MEEGALHIGSTWDGRPLAPEESATLRLTIDHTELRIDVDAPFAGDPAPPAPVGHMDGLWDYEVVELFLLGAGDRYLEIELSPWGHHLGLLLAGVRNSESEVRAIDWRVERMGSRFTGTARVSRAHLPSGLTRCNAYAIRGTGAARAYHACYPVPGPYPDFHRLEHFGPLPFIIAPCAPCEAPE